MAKKFIQAMHMKKGALHKEMHVPEGKKIPAKRLAAAAKKGGKLGRRARFAETLKGLSHHKHSKEDLHHAHEHMREHMR